MASRLGTLIKASLRAIGARSLSNKVIPSAAEVADQGNRIKVLTVALSAVDSEFKALRTEVGRLIDHPKDLHNLSFISLAALLAFIGVLVKEGGAARGEGAVEDLTVVFLLVPLLSLHFALTAADLARRIRQLGGYLNGLTALANAVLADASSNEPLPEVWQWERWKRQQFTDTPWLDKFRTVSMEKSRWLALTFPGLLGIGSYIALDGTLLSGPLEWSLFVGAIVIMAYSIWALVRYPSEAKGVEPPTRIALLGGHRAQERSSSSEGIFPARSGAVESTTAYDRVATPRDARDATNV